MARLSLVQELPEEIRDWIEAAWGASDVDPGLLSRVESLSPGTEPGVTLALCRDLAGARQPRLLAAASLYLVPTEDRRALSLLEALLRSRDELLKCTVLEGLRRHVSPWSFRQILGILGGPDSPIRDRAVGVFRGIAAKKREELARAVLDRGETAAVSDLVEGIARVLALEDAGLFEAVFPRVDLSLKKVLARSLLDRPTRETLRWTKRAHDHIDDPDSRKVLAALLRRLAEALRGEPEPKPRPEPEPEPDELPVLSDSLLMGVLPDLAVAQNEGDPEDDDEVKSYVVEEVVIPGLEALEDIEPAEDPALAEAFGPRLVLGSGTPGEAEDTAPPAETTGGGSPGEATAIEDLLKEVVTRGGSDLHLSAGLTPHIRVDGVLETLDLPPLEEERMIRCLETLIGPEAMERFLGTGDLDLTIGITRVGRFRCNLFRGRGNPALVARLIPHEVPDVGGLGLPDRIRTLADGRRGLLLVTGPTGSGKSTTVAALIDHINTSRKSHVLTLEDPVEFIHRDKLSTISQREIGSDVASFADGIAFADSMDPDVILLGDLRGPEALEAALLAAESGRLVIAMLRGSSSVMAITQIVEGFEYERQERVRASLARRLRGIVVQILCSRVEGGRVPVHEILVPTPAVRRAIREGEPETLERIMEDGDHGMSTLEQSLARRVGDGTLSVEEARLRAGDRERLAKHLGKTGAA